MPTKIQKTTLRAGCKINIFLDIVALREDGYHELNTLFYPLAEPFDELMFEQGAIGSGLTIHCAIAELCTDKNIIYKAWAAYADSTGFMPDLEVTLTKGIPDGAGLGGGSSDAASMLSFLQSLPGHTPLTNQELNALAARIGADVPFFLEGKPAMASGIGEKLTPACISLDGLTLLLVCPAQHVATPWAFGSWDKEYEKQKNKKNTFSLLTLSGLADIHPSSRALWLYNSFEPVVYTAFPELRAYKEMLITHGASGVVMSGSGSSLFALYREMEKATDTKNLLDSLKIANYIHHL